MKQYAFPPLNLTRKWFGKVGDSGKQLRIRGHLEWMFEAVLAKRFSMEALLASFQTWLEFLDLSFLVWQQRTNRHLSECSFSNSLIIHKPKAKEKSLPWRKFGYVVLISIKSRQLWSQIKYWFLWEVISNTRKSVSSDIQPPRNRLKSSAFGLVFQLASRCLDIRWNTPSRVWYITSYITFGGYASKSWSK